ncbi:hypothetical protein, partial [Vibrio metschnikovii]|uniref:hypothetical protein n=1 Tax=Vibrio metschnikovii TaxID=28172 RepID=UPI002FC874E9
TAHASSGMVSQDTSVNAYVFSAKFLLPHLAHSLPILTLPLPLLTVSLPILAKQCAKQFWFKKLRKTYSALF